MSIKPMMSKMTRKSDPSGFLSFIFGTLILCSITLHGQSRQALLPTTTRIEKAFQGRRDALRDDLISMCRKFRRENRSHCEGHHSNEFKLFLNSLIEIFPEVQHDQFSSDSWDEHCTLQVKLKDSRIHSVCMAAAFVMAPFSKKTDMEVKSFQPPPTNTSSLDLVALTVLTAYNHSMSSTIESSCRHGIPIHVLGVGIDRFYAKGLGLKMKLLHKFLNRIPQRRINDTIVLFSDGLDTILQNSREELIRKFLATHARILFRYNLV